ncbi:MAG: hypothetical protein ACOYVK_09460 [Bacillota bacterium]
MRIRYSDNFARASKLLSHETKKILKEKLEIMAVNLQDSSLHSKKIQGQEDIYEIHITENIRMTWQHTEDGIFLRNIGNIE